MATLTTSYQKIATGSSKTFGYATGYLELWAKYNSQDIANNTTNYSVQLRLVVTGGYIGNYQATNYSLSSTGLTTSSGNLGTGDFTSRTIATITGNVTHNSDGTKSISSSGSFNPTAWGISISVSGSATLPTIPRKSGVSASSPYIGDGVSISIDRKASAFRETLSYKIGSLTGVIVEKTSNTVVVFNTSSIADQIYAQIPNAKEISGTITCDTYSGNTLIGTSTTNFNLYAKESVCKPDVDATIVDTNDRATALTGSNTKFIKYISKPKVTVNATAKKSATIKSYSINLNDGQIQNVKEYTFPKINSNKVTVSTTDSRGYSNSNSKTIDIIDYVQLHINKIEISRPEELSSEAYLSLDGVWFNGNFSDAKPNTLTASYQYKAVNDEGWTEGGTLLPIINGNNFSIYNFLLGNAFDYETEYQFQIYFSDALMTVGSNKADVITLPKGEEIVAIGEDKVWINGNVEVKGGESVGGNLWVSQASGDTYCSAKREGGNEVWLVSAGASNNHGVYSKATNKWIVRSNGTDVILGDHKTTEILKQVTRPSDANNANMNTCFEYYNDVANIPTSSGFPGWGTVLGFGNTYRQQLAIGNWTNGGKRVAIRSAVNGEWTGWGHLELQPSVLYDNSSGTSGTVTLSSSAANYSYLEIYYLSYSYKSEKVNAPNGKDVKLHSVRYTNGAIYDLYKVLTISGTNMTVKSEYRVGDFTTSLEVASKPGQIKVVKVLGYL